MAKLWQKRAKLDREIERFTVGDDYLLDRRLIPADAVASIAHAEMLSSIGILTSGEFEDLKRELVRIIEDTRQGKFTVKLEDEDCHTAIENRLTSVVGEVGKKIHTGRSRNDQVIAAIRLYAREFLLDFLNYSLELAESLVRFAEQEKDTPMMGRTHMQIAMPSSVGLWAASYAEQLLDDLSIVRNAYQINNMCPLGSAASYGVPLPLDRKMVSDLLAFEKVQNNVLYVNNSRGKVESILLNAVEQVMLTLSKLAQDLILFSMSEFSYFTLPEEICTGSSIMPQKRNPGMLELIRAKTATVSALNMQVKGIIRGLPSGYNRDFQETKRAFMEGCDIGISSVRIMNLTISKLKVNREKIVKAFKAEIFATDRALELVKEGMPFRDAYREVGLNLEKLRDYDPMEVIKTRTYQGATGNLKLDLAKRGIEEARKWLNGEAGKVHEAIKKLTGIEVELY